MFIENNNNIIWGGMSSVPGFTPGQKVKTENFSFLTPDQKVKMEHYKWVKMIGTGSKVFGLLAGFFALFFLFIKLDQSNNKRYFKHLYEKPDENDPNYTLLNQNQIKRNKELQAAQGSFLTFNMLSIIFICFGFTLAYFSSSSINKLQDKGNTTVTTYGPGTLGR